MSSIILPEKAVQILLANKFEYFNKTVATVLPEIFLPQLYGQTSLTDWINYYDSNKTKVRLGWPNEDTTVPTIYVAAAEWNHDENLCGDLNQWQMAQDTYATEQGVIYQKSAKVIAVSDNYQIALTLAAIAFYFLQQECLWFTQFGMDLPKCAFPEIDFASQLWPAKFFYRSFLITFAVTDTIIISKDDTIKGIDVELVTLI